MSKDFNDRLLDYLLILSVFLGILFLLQIVLDIGIGIEDVKGIQISNIISIVGI